MRIEKEWKLIMRRQQAGFTLMETMVSLLVLLAVSAIVMTGMMQMMKTEGTITNRTEMHTSVRGATELLEQEIGQSGKISLPPLPNANTAWAMLTYLLRRPCSLTFMTHRIRLEVRSSLRGNGSP